MIIFEHVFEYNTRLGHAISTPQQHSFNTELGAIPPFLDSAQRPGLVASHSLLFSSMQQPGLAQFNVASQVLKD